MAMRAPLLPVCAPGFRASSRLFCWTKYAWADRVMILGVSPGVVDNKRLTAEKLAQAIHTAVTDSALRARRRPW